MTQEEVKKQLGFRAADDLIRNGMKIGLGTGSTAVWAVRRLGMLYYDGKVNDILAVPTSSQTEMECQEQGIPLRSMNDPEINGSLDLTIDGVDQIDGSGCMTKGGGGALLIEKIVAYASKKMAVVADHSKLTDALGLSFPIPLEVLPEARIPVLNTLKEMNTQPRVRMAVKKMGAVITDNGNLIIDVTLREVWNPEELDREFSRIPGVLGNGLFTRIKPLLYIGDSGGNIEIRDFN
ncbi:MAG: ribose-5-phosphate isomerase RpiA [Spirochaetia bacterium]